MNESELNGFTVWSRSLHGRPASTGVVPAAKRGATQPTEAQKQTPRFPTLRSGDASGGFRTLVGLASVVFSAVYFISDLIELAQGDFSTFRLASSPTTQRAARSRPRGVEVRPFPPNRRLVVGGERIGRRMAAMHGLLDLDVTTARSLIGRSDPPLSFTAFVVASVARAAAEDPQVHGYRDWRGRLVTHHHVDVTTLVEVSTPQGLFALPHVVRDADVRDVRELSAELRAVKNDYAATGTGRLFDRLTPTLARVPGTVRLLYTTLTRSVRVRQRIGTVAVTAVGMFGQGGGFGIAPLTVMPLQVVVGGVSTRPRVVDGRIEAREVLDLTATFDHNVVDGAPAARFIGKLRGLVERADVLRQLDL